MFQESWRTAQFKTFLVGGWTNPSEKYWSKWESSPSVDEIKKENHHLVLRCFQCYCCTKKPTKLYSCCLSWHHGMANEQTNIQHRIAGDTAIHASRGEVWWSGTVHGWNLYLRWRQKPKNKQPWSENFFAHHHLVDKDVMNVYNIDIYRQWFIYVHLVHKVSIIGKTW